MSIGYSICKAGMSYQTKQTLYNIDCDIKDYIFGAKRILLHLWLLEFLFAMINECFEVASKTEVNSSKKNWKIVANNLSYFWNIIMKVLFNTTSISHYWMSRRLNVDFMYNFLLKRKMVFWCSNLWCCKHVRNFGWL